jgi:archaellum component FlaC
MTTTSNTDIQQLQAFIKDGFNELDKKIDNKFNELDKRIDNKFNELDKRIIKIESSLEGIDKRMSNLESSAQKIPEITEKFGELKNWRQIAFIVIADVLGWFARSGKI